MNWMWKRSAGSPERSHRALLGTRKNVDPNHEKKVVLTTKFTQSNYLALPQVGNKHLTR